VVAVHGDPWLTGEKKQAAEVMGARGVHGKGKRGANDVTVISWFCWAKEKRRESRREHRTRRRRRGGRRTARDAVARAEEGSKEGNRARIGKGRRVEVDPAGGGAAAAAEQRPEATHCAGGRGADQSTCPRKKKRGEGSGGPVWKFQESQGPLGKLKFPTDVEI
jgi:hypothetical protein